MFQYFTKKKKKKEEGDLFNECLLVCKVRYTVVGMVSPHTIYSSHESSLNSSSLCYIEIMIPGAIPVAQCFPTKLGFAVTHILLIPTPL